MSKEIYAFKDTTGCNQGHALFFLSKFELILFYRDFKLCKWLNKFSMKCFKNELIQIFVIQMNGFSIFYVLSLEKKDTLYNSFWLRIPSSIFSHTSKSESCFRALVSVSFITLHLIMQVSPFILSEMSIRKYVFSF